MSRIRIVATLILLAGILLGFFAFGESERFPFRLGLDLSGGTLLTYEANVNQLASSDVDEAMSALRDVIERRVNLFGVAEPLVQVEEAGEEHRLIVELPGVTDVDEAVRQLGETPLLEFELFVGEGLPPEHVSTTTREELYEPTGLTGQFLTSARLQFSGGGQAGGGLVSEPTVVLEFNDEGADLFAEVTRENIGEIVAIFLDGAPITQPVVQGEITGGTAVITGTFSPEEARELARNLNFGALPVPIELVGTQTVGAALGGQILENGVLAGMWGLALVALFMILWYRLPGLVSVLALGIYVIIMLSLFKLIPVTLTAAGIAGFVLSIGMAVDANVLIFERLKEERRAGKPLSDAAREGFRRAWASIRDSNLSTIITAIILFWFGTSLVEGFALVLGIGVLISMLTAISVTRTLLLAVIPSRDSWLFGAGFKK